MALIIWPHEDLIDNLKAFLKLITLSDCLMDIGLSDSDDPFYLLIFKLGDLISD